MLLHKLSSQPVVLIGKFCGRARGAGSELLLACDMRFASLENAIIGQPEVGFGALPGAGGIQHLTRLLGRGRAMEAILGGGEFTAEQAGRYGWINRALSDAELDEFVARLACRVASFPAEVVRTVKAMVNELALPPAESIRADARTFQRLATTDALKNRAATVFARGLQTRGEVELELGARIGKSES
jgi:enoyl-CoA hydratase/carnithine racemase